MVTFSLEIKTRLNYQWLILTNFQPLTTDCFRKKGIESVQFTE